MKAVFTISTSDLKVKNHDNVKRPKGITYPIKASEDDLLVRIIKKAIEQK